MDTLLQSLSDEWRYLLQIAPRVAAACIAVVIALLVGRGAARGVEVLLGRADLSRAHRVFFKNLTRWFFALLGLAVALNVLGLETALAGFVAGSGVAAIVVGFAFREIGENFLAGLFLAFSRPFDIGDFILSENLEGEVREVELRYTHIRTADGRDIYVPNSQLFNKPLVNYTKDGLRRPYFVVGIDYGDDLSTARELLMKAASGTPGVLSDPAPTVTISALAPQYVELQVAFWINTFLTKGADAASRIEQEENLHSIRTAVMERCHRALAAGGLTVSANVTNNLALQSLSPLALDVALRSQQG